MRVIVEGVSSFPATLRETSAWATRCRNARKSRNRPSAFAGGDSRPRQAPAQDESRALRSRLRAVGIRLIPARERKGAICPITRTSLMCTADSVDSWATCTPGSRSALQCRYNASFLSASRRGPPGGPMGNRWRSCGSGSPPHSDAGPITVSPLATVDDARPPCRRPPGQGL